METRSANRLLVEIGIALSVALGASAISEVFFTSSRIAGIFITLLVVIATLLALLTVRTLEGNATTITISVLGFPRTGKTVYLTSLFDELQQTNRAGVQFYPYGSETVEEVTRNLNALSKGIWLPATIPGSVFFYRANASMNAGIFKKRYKVEIADYAGESIGELNPSDEKWLHKTDYFKYVVQSDAIILALDTELLIASSKERVDEMQNAFVAAFQILAEHKGALDGRRLKAPVSLLFLKTDLALKYLPDFEEVLPQRVSRLVRVCEGRCLNFKYFFVSSIGELGPDETPPKHLRPFGVVEPLIWLLRHTRRA